MEFMSDLLLCSAFSLDSVVVGRRRIRWSGHLRIEVVCHFLSIHFFFNSRIIWVVPDFGYRRLLLDPDIYFARLWHYGTLLAGFHQ